MGKQDSTGSYAYLCDGTAPGSSVLSDGHAFYTPGLSENRGGAVSYPAFDRLGNLWTQDASGASQLYYQDTSGFGTPSFSGGGAASPFKFGGGNGCQTDADTGLVLMGHRYYDARTGRFLTQDPAGDGDNWYSYADNDPMDDVDPEGLAPTPGMWSPNGGAMADSAGVYALMGGGGPWGGAPGHYMHVTTGSTTVGGLTTFYGYDHWVSDGPGLLAGVAAASSGGLYSTFMKENRMWINYAKVGTQGASRFASAFGGLAIYGGVDYLRHPQAGFANNVVASVGGYGSFVTGIGVTEGGLSLAGGSTIAAVGYGSLAAATGVGLVVVGGAVATVGAYRASDYWVNNTASGQAFTDSLGAGAYSVGKFFGVYNFIVPYDLRVRIKPQSHKPRHVGHHLRFSRLSLSRQGHSTKP